LRAKQEELGGGLNISPQAAVTFAPHFVYDTSCHFRGSMGGMRELK
jgi:hypothetical protein